MIHDGEGTGLIYKRELCGCCWTRVKLSSCFQFHASHRGMPETQLYFHTSCEETFWQPAVSSTPDALALQNSFLNQCCLRKDELLYKAQGMYIAYRTRSSASTNLRGLSNLTGAKLIYPVSLQDAGAPLSSLDCCPCSYGYAVICAYPLLCTCSGDSHYNHQNRWFWDSICLC